MTTTIKPIERIHHTADTLAADLAVGQVDPNEAQKALAYLRHSKDPQQFFAYLKAINTHGKAVIRSGRTLSYYRELQSACERHLRDMSAEEMAQTLGWAIRLLRYYKSNPDKVSPPGERHIAQNVAPDRGATSPPAPSKPVERPPEPDRPIETRTPGIVSTAATQDEMGVIEDGDGRQYRYNLDDVVGTPPNLHAKVRFNPTKKKIETRKGKRKEKKNVPWADSVERESDTEVKPITRDARSSSKGE